MVSQSHTEPGIAGDIFERKYIQNLSVAPQSADYPAYSPYNYTLNSPIRLVDPDGNGAKTTVKSEDGQNTVYVESTIYIYQAKGDNIDLNGFATTLEESLNRQFNEGNPTMRAINPSSKRSERMSAKFIFTVKVLDGDPKNIANEVKDNKDISNNYFLVHNLGGEGGIDSHAYGGNSGILQKNAPENIWAHEMMHSMGYTSGVLENHSTEPSSVMYPSPNANAKISQTDIDRLNKGNAAGSGGLYGKGTPFGFGKRNYIYSGPSRDPIINPYKPSNKVSWIP